MTKNQYSSFISRKEEYLLRLQEILNFNGFPNWTLSYEKESIDELERAYLTLLDRDVSFNQPEMDETIMTYIGEASIHHLGGKWAYGEHEDFLGYQQAIIIEYKNWGGIPISPENKLKRIKEREKTNCIWNTIHFVLNKDSIQKDLMEEMRNLGKKKKK